MCGRYNLICDAQALVDFFKTHNRLDTRPRYNIAPSQEAPVVRAGENGPELAWMHWGLLPHWARERKFGYHTINARAETVASKPAFRESFRRHRCLVGHADNSVSLSRGTSIVGKQPFHIRVGEGRLFAFAGLWSHWEKAPDNPLDSFSIIVTGANDTVRPVHDRMPVILHPDDYDTWLDPTLQDPEQLQPLLRPCPATWLNTYPVSTRVNKPGNDDPACLDPAEPTA